MGKLNKTFTEDMTKYKAFLETTNKGLYKAVEDMHLQIKSRQKIIDIIQKYQEKHTIATQDMIDLVTMSCPDFDSFELLLDMINGCDEDNAEKVSTEYKTSINCAGKKCQDCWKEYINTIAYLLNTSPVDIKNLNPEED